MDAPKTELPQGTLDLLVLQVAAHGPVHGYGIAQRIRCAMSRWNRLRHLDRLGQGCGSPVALLLSRHLCRSASIGSTREARWAGTTPAASATAARPATAAAMTAGGRLSIS